MQEKELREVREEFTAYKEQDEAISRDNKTMTGEIGELRLQLERLLYETKEAAITSDAMREQNGELSAELNEFKVSA